MLKCLEIIFVGGGPIEGGYEWIIDAYLSVIQLKGCTCDFSHVLDDIADLLLMKRLATLMEEYLATMRASRAESLDCLSPGRPGRTPRFGGNRWINYAPPTSSAAHASGKIPPLMFRQRYARPIFIFIRIKSRFPPSKIRKERKGSRPFQQKNDVDIRKYKKLTAFYYI